MTRGRSWARLRWHHRSLELILSAAALQLLGLRGVVVTDGPRHDSLTLAVPGVCCGVGVDHHCTYLSGWRDVREGAISITPVLAVWPWLEEVVGPRWSVVQDPRDWHDAISRQRLRCEWPWPVMIDFRQEVR
jgi:hypothetical protein